MLNIQNSIEDNINFISKKLYNIENEWIKENLKYYNITSYTEAKFRCKIGTYNKACVWDTLLYIDDRLVSILKYNSSTTEVTIENNHRY